MRVRPMRIDVLTLFPEMFAATLGSSILKRAADRGLVSYHLHQLRDFTTDPHRKVDDRPFGGGPGMVLMPQPVIDAVRAIELLDPQPATRLLMCPQGETLSQRIAAELATLPRLMLIAGHYEGFDERIKEILEPRQISIGDVVLSGGELPALVTIDAVVRLIPGVLGHDESTAGESFAADDPVIAGGLEYPHYTRPRDFEGRSVPEVLLSGNHAAIAAWRTSQSRERTKKHRPDLLRRTETNGTQDAG
jgi:tRNA (guanine37-N1)-methyltransferase